MSWNAIGAADFQKSTAKEVQSFLIPEMVVSARFQMSGFLPFAPAGSILIDVSRMKAGSNMYSCGDWCEKYKNSSSLICTTAMAGDFVTQSRIDV